MMARALLLLLGLLLSLSAAAQQVPNPMARDGTNAQLPAAQANLALYQDAVTGNKTTGNSPGDYGGIWTLAATSITSDTATNTMPSSGIAAHTFVHQFGGVGAGEASRFGIWVNLQQTGPLPLGTGQHPFHTGIFSNVTSNYDSGGMGQLYGYAGQVAAGPGYTNTYGLVGGEIDISNSSPSVNLVEGWGVANVPLTYGIPTQHGRLHDAGYGLWAGPTCGAGSLAGGSGCAGFNVGFSFGRFDSYFPIDPQGTLISVKKGVGAAADLKAGWGIRFIDDDGTSAVQFSYCAFGSQGVCIDGHGNYIVNNQSPTLQMTDSSIASPYINSGRMRLVSNGAPSGTNTFQFQFNTAVAGDFTTVATPLAFGVTGTYVDSFHIIQSTPATSSSPCGAGQLAIDATYIYTCTATNTWRRLANGATW